MSHVFFYCFWAVSMCLRLCIVWVVLHVSVVMAMYPLCCVTLKCYYCAFTLSVELGLSDVSVVSVGIGLIVFVKSGYYLFCVRCNSCCQDFLLILWGKASVFIIYALSLL